MINDLALCGAIAAFLVGLVLLVVVLPYMAARRSNRTCRRPGGPCLVSIARGHCMSPNGCGDWSPPSPRRAHALEPSRPAPPPPRRVASQEFPLAWPAPPPTTADRSILDALDKPLVPPVHAFEIPLRRIA